MAEAPIAQALDSWGGPLLGAYELVLGAVSEGGSDQELLRCAA